LENREASLIEEKPELIVNLEPEVILELGENYNLEALVNIPESNIESITWEPAVNLDCPNCLNPGINTLLSSQRYKVTITDQNGCAAVAETFIRVEKNLDVFIPNAFSPTNQDGARMERKSKRSIF